MEHTEDILATIEPQDLVKVAYPDLVLSYSTEIENRKKGKYFKIKY